ncbi:tetratricopeptide repeat protein [Limibacter armeniacum]
MNTRLFFLLFFLLGDFYVYSNKTDSYNLPITQINEISNDSLRLQYLDSLLSTLATSQMDNKLAFYDSLEKNIHFSHEKFKAEFYLNLTSNYSYINQYQKGKLLSLQAAEVFTRLGDKPQLAKAYYILGLIHNKINDLDDALNYLLKSLQIQEDLSPSINLAHAYNAIGGVYDLLEKDSKSFEYYQKALKQFKIYGNLKAQALAYNNLGLLMQRQGNIKDALDFMLQAQEIFESEQEVRLQTRLIPNIASLYIDLGEFEKAEHIYLKASKSLSQYEDPNTLAHINAGLGNLYMNMGKLEQAERLLRKAAPFLQPFNAMRVYSNLASIDTLRNDYKAFAHDHLKYVTLKDSIYDEEKMLKISELENSYESKLKDKEIQLLQKDNKIKRSQLLFMVIAIVAILLLLLTLYFRYRVLMHQKKLNLIQIEKQNFEKLRLEENYYAEQKIREIQKRKYHEDLDEKNRQLASASFHTISKNKTLKQVSDSIQDFLENDKPKTSLNHLQKLINNNLNLDEDWEQFKLQFEKVNPDFFKKLHNNYKQLTDNDLRLLAYMRINLSTKEIAQMLNISSKSVNMSRYRLRKKIGLDKDEELRDFIQNI